MINLHYSPLWSSQQRAALACLLIVSSEYFTGKERLDWGLDFVIKSHFCSHAAKSKDSLLREKGSKRKAQLLGSYLWHSYNVVYVLMWHLCKRKRKASIEKGYRSSSGMKSSPGSRVAAVYKQVLFSPICIRGLGAPFNPFACWRFFNTQLWFSFLTIALNQEIRPTAGFRKDVCSHCPCHPVFHGGEGHCTEEVGIGVGNFVSCLLGKHGWCSWGAFFSHPWAWLTVKLGSQTNGHRMQMQAEMAGRGPPLEFCSSFNSVKKKIQSFPSNNHYIIYFSSSHFVFCLFLVSKHWDWLRACLQVPFISTGTASTILFPFSSEHIILQKAVQTSSQSLGLADLAQPRFLKI